MAERWMWLVCIAISVAGSTGAARADEATARPERGGTAAKTRTDERGLVACDTTVGRKEAERLRDLCIGISPATHPSCGTRNSCALIEDEIARSCAIIGDRVAAKTSACTAEPTSAAAAVDVLRRFYAAIDARDYDTAYAMLRPDRGKGQGLEAFRQGYAATRSTRVTAGKPGEMEGAARSVYVTIPVTVDAVLDDGRRQRFLGSFILRRIDGENTPPLDEQRWHIFSAHLELERGNARR